MTLSEIRRHIEERDHWKKGDEWWAEHLDVPLAKVKEALGKLDSANASDYDDYDSTEQHDNENKNRAGASNNEPTALQDQTLDEYLTSVGLDPEKVDKYNDVKYWTDQRGNRRYSVVPKNLDESAKDFQEALIQAIKDATPKEILPNPPKETNPCAAVINLYDAHFDKLSQIGEGYTMEDNIALIRRAISNLLHDIKEKKPEAIYLPVGNDFFDGNDFRNTTKRGTPQEQQVHWKQGFQIGLSLIKDIINACSKVADKVIVIAIEGNHDEDKVFYLNEVLKEAYNHTHRIEVTPISKPRYYFKYGLNMLGFGHGYNEKKKIKHMPAIMATEAPNIWGNTEYREMLLGDVHHKEEYKFLKTEDQQGCTVSFLRDIGLTHSTWDRQNGYHVGPKSVEAQIYDRSKGKIATLLFNV